MLKFYFIYNDIEVMNFVVIVMSDGNGKVCNFSVVVYKIRF